MHRENQIERCDQLGCSHSKSSITWRIQMNRRRKRQRRCLEFWKGRWGSNLLRRRIQRNSAECVVVVSHLLSWAGITAAPGLPPHFGKQFHAVFSPAKSFGRLYYSLLAVLVTLCTCRYSWWFECPNPFGVRASNSSAHSEDKINPLLTAIGLASSGLPDPRPPTIRLPASLWMKFDSIPMVALTSVLKEVLRQRVRLCGRLVRLKREFGVHDGRSN